VPSLSKGTDAIPVGSVIVRYFCGAHGDGEVIWLPYCGAAPIPGELWSRWNLDPVLLLALALGAAAFVRWGGAEPARRRCFAAVMALVLLLFVSPFCALTSALFSARVTHHILLTALFAPLLAAAWPATIRGGVALWAGLHAVVFWGWHAPPVYGWALSSDAGYWLMQLSLLGSAFALWSAIRTAPVPGAIVALLGTMVQMGLLGALITFAPVPLYAPHLRSTMAWGLSPLEDQQLAGLIMWAPGAAAYLLAALLLLSRWFAREQATV
jgi:putative membrane protein